jgi:signal peptidase I
MIADLIGSDLTTGDQIRFLVTSNSMQPIIKIGDTVLAEVILVDEVKLGDIIVIKRIDDFLTHRAISPTKHGWITKGDSNILPDPPIKPANIIGRVRMVQRTNQMINFETRKWIYINPLLAKLSQLETWAFLQHRYLRILAHIMFKIIQIFSAVHLEGSLHAKTHNHPDAKS